MYAFELFEQEKPRVIVTYPGRFQPFHQGHAGVFAQLQKRFGSDNVFILTSNDTSSTKSPFNFSDKYQLITAAGVPGDRIIETNSMYSLPDAFDPAKTIFVTAVGAPDATRLNPNSVLKKDKKDKDGNVIKPAGSPGYYKTLSNNEDPVTADQHGYVVVIPEIKKAVSIGNTKYDASHGTEVRALWNLVRRDPKKINEFLSQLYLRPSQELVAIYNKIPETASEDISVGSADSTSPIHGRPINEMGGTGVVANKKQAKDPRYSMSLTKDVRPGQIEKNLKAFKLAEGIDPSTMLDLLEKFLPIAMKDLKLDVLPPIRVVKHVAAHGQQATFGNYNNNEKTIKIALSNRHPVDILRTLAHELVHFKQHTLDQLNPNSGETGSNEENQANAVAGVIMRHFNLTYPDAVNLTPLELNEHHARSFN